MKKYRALLIIQSKNQIFKFKFNTAVLSIELVIFPLVLTSIYEVKLGSQGNNK